MTSIYIDISRPVCTTRYAHVLKPAVQSGNITLFVSRNASYYTMESTTRTRIHCFQTSFPFLNPFKVSGVIDDVSSIDLTKIRYPYCVLCSFLSEESHPVSLYPDRCHTFYNTFEEKSTTDPSKLTKPVSPSDAESSFPVTREINTHRW